MRFVITTWRRDPKTHTFILIRERKCGDLTEALGVWMRAMRDFSVDRITIKVDK